MPMRKVMMSNPWLDLLKQLQAAPEAPPDVVGKESGPLLPPPEKIPEYLLISV
jgi:hypothetical protein